MNQQQQQPRTLPSFSGLSEAVAEARDFEKSRSSVVGGLDVNNLGGNAANRRRHASPTSETAATAVIDVGRPVTAPTSAPSKTDASGNILVQDTLTPLLDEVDALFERSKEIIADITAQGKQHDEDVEVVIMERMADAWQSIEAKNSRHDTSHKLHREKPMFCMDSLGKRIKAALLCKTLPKDDNPAEYVNGSSSSPSRNLVTAIKLAGYVVHCGTGGKVSAVDGDGREPPSMYTKEEFHNNVLPRAAENQPPRILNELRQLSCRLVASGIAKGLLKAEDLPEIRKTLIARFEDGGMHFLAGGDAAFTRFIGVAANAHRLLERGDVDDFVRFHERVVKLVGMCRNRVRRAAYATSKNMLAQAEGNGRFVAAKSPTSRRKLAPLPQPKQQKQQPPTLAPQAPPQAPVSAAYGVHAAAGVHGRPAPPHGLAGQGQYDGLAAAAGGASPAAPYGKPPLENGGAGFGGPAGFNNGGGLVRVPRAGAGAPPSHDPKAYAPQASDAANGGAAAAAGAPPFHDHNALSAAAPEILTQMGYGRAPAFGPDGVWNSGSAGGARGQVAPSAPAPAPVVRMDAPPVLVLQPGWGVTLPPYFLGMMDPKRPRNVPVKMLWELRAEPLPGSSDSVLVEMRQVPGYLDFLAEIMPPDMLKFRWSRRCWETMQGKNDTRALLEEAAAAVHHLGLVPMPPGSALRQVYDDLASHGGAMAAVGLNGANNANINNVINSSGGGGGNGPINVGSSSNTSSGGGANPANPEAAQARPPPHSAAHADGSLMHAASLGVPPVAAGVLRDMHRQGALNGEAANMWGDASGGGNNGGGGSANPSNPNPNPGMERAAVGAPPPATVPSPSPARATAPVPAPAPAAPGGSAGFSPGSESGGVSSGGGTPVSVGGGAMLPTGHWAPPPALPGSSGSSSGVNPNTSGANGNNSVNVGMNHGGANPDNAAGKRKAGAAFSDTGSPQVDTDW
eukprot:g2920.t1